MSRDSGVRLNRCPVCDDRVDTRTILCDRCASRDGSLFLYFGDAPMIMSILTVIISFILMRMEQGEVFHLKGVELPFESWALLFLALSGLFLVFSIPFLWRSFTDRGLYRFILKVLSPMAAIMGFMYMLMHGIVILSLSIMLAGLMGMIISIVIERKWNNRQNILDFLIYIVIAIIFFSASILSIGGVIDIAGIGLFFPPLAAGAGIILLLPVTYRMGKNLSFQAKFASPYLFTILSVLFGFLCYFLERQYGSSELIKILWFTTLALVEISTAMFMLKRRNDSLILNSFKNHDMHGSIADIMIGEKNFIFALHHLDRSISDNPFHGMGMKPESGNVLFMLEGTDTKPLISQESDEYTIAHIEKAYLLSSRGRLTEALKELKKGAEKRPDSYHIYYHLATLESTLGANRKELTLDLEMFLTSRKMYFQRLLSRGFPESYLKVFNELYHNYVEDVERRIEILAKLGRSTDVMPYFTIAREL